MNMSEEAEAFQACKPKLDNQEKVDSKVQQSLTDVGPQLEVVGPTENYRTEIMRRAKHHKKWNRRLKVLFCCLGYKKNKESIADVASIFAEFYADMDVPSTDIAAGFVLLSKYQAAQRQWVVKNHHLGVDQYLSSVPITQETKFLDISTAEDSHLINDLIYYMNYSLAIFGWPVQMVEDPCMLCCLCPYLNVWRCSGRRRRIKQAPTNSQHDEVHQNDTAIDHSGEKVHNLNAEMNSETKEKTKSISEAIQYDETDIPIILEDNCCGCNVASVERRLRAHNYEIIYVTYKAKVNVIPFLVAADHSKQTIVVALRGSMSLSDMITDMNGQVDRLPIENCPDDWLCHRGITRASSYVEATLRQEYILERAFNCRPDIGSQDYNLVLCGHSLGAGVAAILGIMLRNRYPTLKAYIYSPPGGMLSLPVVEYTKQFATGIILGNDCVPRLGVAQLERLRYQVLLSLKSSNKSSSKILFRALCPSKCFGSNKVDYDPSQSLNLLYGKGGRSFDYNGCKIPFQVQPQVLYVPGRLIHIVKNHSFKSKARRIFNEPIYQAVWSDNTDYDRVLISDGMFFDHLPYNLMHAMKMLFSKTLPYRKESKTSNLSNNCVSNTHQVTASATPEVHLIPSKPTDRAILGDENNNDYNGRDKFKLELVKSDLLCQKNVKTDQLNHKDTFDKTTKDGLSDHHESSSDDKFDVNGNCDSISNRNI